MIVDGKKIAEDLKHELQTSYDISYDSPLSLHVVVVGDNPVTERFVSAKKKFGEVIGVSVVEHRLPDTASTDAVVDEVKVAAKEGGGIVVQLPLPLSIDTQKVLNAIPPSCDVDVLSDEAYRQFEQGTSSVLPPVVGAVREVLERHKVVLKGKRAVVIGRGRLVGKPVAAWLSREGAYVTVASTETTDLSSVTSEADLIVSGVGVPSLIKPEMIKEGSVLIDAGTSEQGGKTVGDIDPACAEGAALFTPTPGGIGPITVAMLFKNLLALQK
jgi:methylenetetrahydrofolate dehydrogenase (NADP+)/methenyltetrahydrofolate cyclohydrolase